MRSLSYRDRAGLVVRRLASLFIRQGDERRKAVEKARLGRTPQGLPPCRGANRQYA